MIIQCDKCRTKFRLDDSRVSDKGVKVRCTKCKSVFRVQKDTPEVAPFVSEAAHNDQNETLVAPSEDTLFGTAPVAESSPEYEIGADTTLQYESEDRSGGELSQFDPSAFSFESDLLLDEDKGTVGAVAEEPAASDGEVDFTSFDFGDGESEVETFSIPAVSGDEATTAEMPETATQAEPRKEVLQGLDFSDDMFGAVVQPTPEPSSEPITFDFEGDSFAESMDMGSRQPGGKGGTLFSLDTSADAPFNLDDIDFGDELTSVAIQQVNPDDLQPAQKTLFAPLADAQGTAAAAGDAEQQQPVAGDISVGDLHELPPLSIASRRKQSPIFTGLIAVVAILVISVLGYFGYTSLSSPKDNASQDTGKIGIQSVKAVYITNDSAGELLVVSGEALNEYPKPRAALQVKVTVFDSTGQSIATKSAYGGNPLTEEQLESLPLDKIEAAMANQFGDSLANMEVAPGKAIPFVVVLANIPKGAKDFGVQSAGSTVATGKQQ
ncbi:MAG: DUF3426 domain-containing protein [Desulfuromonadaceae bacterium]|nr:DUF3426 domain-containing protein [Desulfuromonadaceae bacterium]